MGETFCDQCVTDEDYDILIGQGYTVELCDDCANEMKAERKWDERFE